MKLALPHLVVKEIRQLLPVLVLWSAVLLIGYVSQFFTIRFDEQSFSKWCSEFCHPGLNVESMFYVVVTAIFCIVTAYSLFPREHDESTIDFLKALPVSGFTIFIAKCLAAWVSVSVISALSYLFDFGLLTLNVQSIDGKAYPRVMAVQALRDILFAYVVIAHGVFLSRFRTPGLVVYALYFLGLVWWENAMGSAGAFNLFAFYTNNFSGQRLLLNWHVIIPHVIAATFIYCLAFILWSRTESRVTRHVSGGRRSKWIGVMASVVAFVVFGAVMAGRFVADTVVGDRQVTETAHYDFISRPDSRDAVDALAIYADEDYQALRDLLRAGKEPDIVADLTANKGHVAGLAVWKKIQMDISDGQTDLYYRRVLSHETAHVFQSVMSARNMAADANSTTFFTEGMAQLTSFRIVPDETTRRKNWIVAALAWKRHKIRFRDLSNYSGFEKRFDAELVYTLADTWVEALVQTCGDRILGDVLRSAGREDAPKGLNGEQYWRNTLQYADCELESVNVTWSALMNDSLSVREDEYPEFGAITFARNPDASVTVTVELLPADLNYEASSDSFAETLDYFLKIEQSDVLLKQFSPIFRADLDNDGGVLRAIFHVPAANVSSDRVRYQVGFRPEADARLFFERWRSNTILSERQSKLDVQ